MSGDSSNYSDRHPPGSATTFVYDAVGRLTSCVDRDGLFQVVNYDGTGSPKGAAPRDNAVILVPADVTGRTGQRFAHTFEFRLSGSEEVEQSIPLPPVPASACLMAAAKAVRVSVTRSPDAKAASIGGVEVHAEVRGKQVICVARVTDFSADDLVVVQADVIVRSEQVLPE